MGSISIEDSRAKHIVADNLRALQAKLDHLRLEFDRTDANHPYDQIEIATEIATTVEAQKKAFEVYEILGGDKTKFKGG